MGTNSPGGLAALLLLSDRTAAARSRGIHRVTQVESESVASRREKS